MLSYTNQRLEPLVSVVVPFYNTPPRFLEDAIGSVLNQSYGRFELLLVDDGSTDESTAIAAQHAARYPGKVRYLDHSGHRHRGVNRSRQLGLSRAEGKYIALLDADDVWLPHKLEQQVAILESRPEAGMLYGSNLFWYSWTGHPKDLRRDFVPRSGLPPDTVLEPPALLRLLVAEKVAVPCPCSVILRRDVVEKVDGFAGIESFMNEDQMFYAKVCLETSVFVSKECWDRYRQHPDSVSARAARKGEIASSRLTYLKWLADYLHRKEVADADLWRALRRQLWLYRQPTLLRYDLTRITKKWLLRLEEHLLPAATRRLLLEFRAMSYQPCYRRLS